MTSAPEVGLRRSRGIAASATTGSRRGRRARRGVSRRWRQLAGDGCREDQRPVTVSRRRGLCCRSPPQIRPAADGGRGARLLARRARTRDRDSRAPAEAAELARSLAQGVLETATRPRGKRYALPRRRRQITRHDGRVPQAPAVVASRASATGIERSGRPTELGLPGGVALGSTAWRAARGWERSASRSVRSCFRAAQRFSNSPPARVGDRHPPRPSGS
jgi:hypothetical protein